MGQDIHNTSYRNLMYIMMEKYLGQTQDGFVALILASPLLDTNLNPAHRRYICKPPLSLSLSKKTHILLLKII